MKISTFNRATALRLVTVGLAAAMLAGCGQQSPERLMASAKDYLAKGDRNAAVIELKNLLTKAPDNGEARLLLGQAMLDADDFVSAEKELQRALELKQPHEKVVPAYVRALLGQGKYRAVIAEVEKYKLFDPTAVAATQTALGDAQMRLGNRARAGEAYAAALAAVPAYSRARLGQANIIALEGRLEEALKEADAIAAAEPTLAEAHGLKADILLAKGDRVGAKKALQEAIAASDRYLPARLTMITLLTEERDYEGAASLISSSRKVAPNDLRLVYQDAVLAYRKGDLERGRQQAQQVLKYLPEHVPTLVLMGSIDFQSKQFAAAEISLRKAIARVPSHLGARRLLIQTYLRMGQPAKAKEVLQPLVDSGLPDDPPLQLLAGETFLANGDVQRAATFYQAAAKGKSAPQIAARTRLGQIALAAGRSDEGFAELEAVSELDADLYQADLALIAAHLRRKEIDKAMEAARELEKKQPTNPLTFQMYGSIYLAKRDLDGARKSFERALELQPTYLPSAYSLAQIDILQKKPQEARKRYEAMIAKEPNNEQLYIALAELEAGAGGNQKEAIATLRRAVQASPQAPAARLALINSELRAGDTKAALAASQEALAAMPSDSRILAAAGIAQEAAGEINQAIDTYNKLASLQPQSPQPLYRLAALYFRQKETDKAIETLRRVQKIAPRERDVVPQLVQVYVASGRYDEAFREARQLQKREPKYAGGFALEGDVYFAQRKFDEAERAYRTALKLDPRANAVVIKLHTALLAAGKRSDAEALSRKWLVENPKDVPMRLYLGERERAAGNLRASAGHYGAVIEIDQNNVLALNNLAWIGGEIGDPKALAYAERALNLAPLNASVLDTYGMLLMKKSESDKALRFLSLAHQMAPKSNDIRLHYAKALLKAGRKTEARKELEVLQGVKESFAGKEEVAGLLKEL